jgi:hypothetical protein
VSAASAQISTMAHSAAPPQGGPPSFGRADDFYGAAGAPPNASIWTVADEPGLSGNKELEYYSPTHVALDGKGNLVLLSDETVTKGFNYTSGWVESAGKYNVTVRDVPVKWEVR